MKKLILLLLISGGLSAQVVVPKSTTTFSNIVATGSETVTGNLKVGGAITSPTIYGSSAASGVLNVFGTSSPTAGVVNIGMSTGTTQINSLTWLNNKLRVGSNTIPSATLDVTGTMSVSGVVETSTINAQGGQLNLFTAGFNRLIVNNTFLRSTPVATVSGAVIPFDFQTASNYSITASTNVPAFKVTGATRGFLSGAKALQYESYLTAPTYTANGATTITTASGLHVEKPIAGSNITITNNYGISTDGGIGSTSKTDGIGYAVGSGSTVTQATSRTTGVTINAVTGAITLVSAAGSTSWQSFTVTNSAVAASDVIIVEEKSGTDLYMINVTNIAAGSFKITFATTGGTTTEQPVFNFAVIKGQTN